MDRLVSVALPIPGIPLLTYRVPVDLPLPPVGARVLVPLGARVLTGCVTSVAELTPASGARTPTARVELRDILDVFDDEPFVPVRILELARWVADYYACAPGEALAAAMPPRAWVESERRVGITDRGRARRGKVTGVRGAILNALADTGTVRTGSLAHLVRLPPSTRRPSARRRGLHAAVRSLARDGLVEVRQTLRGTASAFRTARVATLKAEGLDFADQGRRLGPRQQAALDLLRGVPEGRALGELARRGISATTVARLARRGLVTITRRRIDRDPFGGSLAAASLREFDASRALTTEQAAAFDRLAALAARPGFHVALLRGVTGSGKTEIYLRLARVVRGTGRGVLILVPEIALTPALTAVFRAAVGGRVAVQHSGLSDGERHDQWHRIRRGEVDVVIGTRSAVFAPLPSVGLIVVDEEHDASYKQDEGPRYHGRDVAVMRGRHERALVVLGSATPSIESYSNALAGRYECLTIERRVLDRPLAAVSIVDMREQYAAEGPDVVLSAPLLAALGDRLARREQALVLLNRRGFAAAVFCRQCGGTAECSNCSVSLTVHRKVRRAICHYCSFSTSIPTTCPTCAAPYLELIGFGTERIEREIEGRFPGARIGRVDRDSIRRRGALVELLERFGRGELDILVGTQMIAKGHDFPRVTLVGVVSADIGLGLADFRAAERTFQLLTQVAGRAGRGEHPGEAIVQTLYPAHYSIRHACRQDYLAFFADELKYRQSLRYPPAVSLINTVVRGRTAGEAFAGASDLVRELRRSGGPFRVLGPAPAALGRLRGEHRAQFFLKGAQRAPMRAALVATLNAHPSLRHRVTVDVDPMTVL